MEKYYCDHCRLLYNEQITCAECGCEVSKKIIIDVQNQNTSSHAPE